MARLIPIRCTLRQCLMLLFWTRTIQYPCQATVFIRTVYVTLRITIRLLIGSLSLICVTIFTGTLESLSNRNLGVRVGHDIAMPTQSVYAMYPND
jgi:hypothetical protein